MSVFVSLTGWLAVMGFHLPNLSYSIVAVLGVVFCGGYNDIHTILDTVTGIL